MAKRKPPKRLFKGQEHVSSYHARSRAPGKLMKQMARDHEDVLQNIEAVIIARYRADGNVDDRAVDEALRACMGGKPADDPVAADLVKDLEAVRALREDVPDDVWRDGLQVVHDSVKRHSQLRPGETSYLEFTQPFFP
jgi:hypothetical protein